MSIRRSHKNGQSNSNSGRFFRMKEKATRLREQIKNLNKVLFSRQQQRVTWWQRAFRTPLVGFQSWVFAKASSLWAAFLALIGFKAKTPKLEKRRGEISRSKTGLRSLMHEGLESRQLMAVLYADQVGDYVVTTNNAGGAGADPTDIVRWVGFNGVDDGGAGDDVSGLTFGTDAFGSIQDAINGGTKADTVKVAPGDYAENLTLVGENLIMIGPNTGKAGTAVRVAEANLQGTVSVDGTSVLNWNGFRVENSVAGAQSIVVKAGGSATVVNSVFFSTIQGGGSDTKALTVEASGGGTVIFNNNYVTGAHPNKFGTASWGEGFGVMAVG